MKLKYFALSMAFVMAAALTGCSANRDIHNTASMPPTNSVSSDGNDRASAGVGGNVQNSADIGSAQNSASIGNDAAQGGGAGGTNDQNNDGTPDGGAVPNGTVGRNYSGTGTVIDDIGDAAGNLARGTGNAIGDAANNIGNAMR